MVETRLLTNSTSFNDRATTWGVSVGLLDINGDPTAVYPQIIGVIDGSEDLGAFNLGIISSGRTIKGALQDLETAVNGRMFAANNLSDLPNKAQARSNLELGSAAQWNIGTSGAVVPLMSAVNSWNGKQSFLGGLSSTTTLEILGSSGATSSATFFDGNNKRWSLDKDSSGSNFNISRYNDAGTFVDSPLVVNRSTGVVSLSQPLPITSGGTGVNSLVNLKTALSISNVDNTSDANKPVSTATATALATKFDKAGGSVSGFVSATGFVRSSDSIISLGTSIKGGGLILGYRDSGSISQQTNNTWNVDVDSSNNLRVFRINSSGVSRSFLTFGESGQASFTNGVTVSGDGNIANFIGSNNPSQVILIDHKSTSGSQGGSSSIAFRNEVDVAQTHIAANIGIDGGTTLSISATAAGDRNVDRRQTVITFGTSSITAAVPINGRAYPRSESGSDLKFNWSSQPSQPTGLFGSNDGVNVYAYNPTNFSVNNSANLGNIAGGNGGGYIRRSTDSAANGTMSSQLIVSGNLVTEDVWSSPVEIRELNLVGAAQSAATYAPGIAFHWSGRSAAALKMHSDGSLRARGSTGSALSYTNFWAASFYSNSNYRVSGNGGLVFEDSGRGIAAAEAGSGYGQVTTTGAGLNGYSGYSIGTWASFMSNGSLTGIYNQSGNRWLVQWNAGGDATFVGNITAYSDERLKYNKRPINDVELRRAGLAQSAILYERDGITRVGFGAQTLEKTNPEVVFTADDLIGTKSVNYGDIVAILAADNQILSERISSLENMVKDLLDRLKDRE